MFCFYYRYRLHRYMDRRQKPNTPRLQRHLSKCAACRDYHGRMVRLDTHMKESACGTVSETTLRRIEASVLKTIGSSPAVGQRTIRNKSRLPYAVAACFMMIAGLFGWSYYTHHRNIRAVTAVNDAIASLNRAAAFGDSTSLLKLLTEQSTQKEMDKFMSNARNTVTYITNCIPQDPSGDSICLE